MKNCPNCGSPMDPYRVKCEYCGTMYFDWATWLQDGEPCYINYGFDSVYGKGAITTRAIPHLETIDVVDCLSDTTNMCGITTSSLIDRRSCELHITFTCIENKKDDSLFKLTLEQ